MKLILLVAVIVVIPAVYCAQDGDPQYFLYTRSNPTAPITLNPENPEHLQGREKVVIIVHGASASANQNDFPVLKDEYLARYDCNVILLDWSNLAAEPYWTIIRKTPELSQKIAKFLCTVHQQLKVSLETVHIIGHSCGAQVAGFIGKYTIATCEQIIGRITGLDPAGPVYNLYPKEKRLDKSDAKFVDVIHTNSLGAGYHDNCGHVDFHVNCGGLQIGCAGNIFECSHLRAIDYMIESVNKEKNNFVSQSCLECPKTFCKADEVDPEYILMGEDCPQNSTNNAFWLTTNPSPPFGVGLVH